MRLQLLYLVLLSHCAKNGKKCNANKECANVTTSKSKINGVFFLIIFLRFSKLQLFCRFLAHCVS